MIKAKIITSLEKVFPEGMQEGYEIKEIKGCLGETVSFQIAYHWQEPMKAYGKVQMEGSKEILDRTTVRQVELVPSQYPWAIDGDDGYIKKEPGLYPDLLRDLPNLGFMLVPDQWRSLWFTIELPKQPGNYELAVQMNVEEVEGEGNEFHAVLPVQVINQELPQVDVRHTEWFHGDCLADYYQVEVFSEEHWRILENFLAVAAKRSCDTILTPLFTPPLDTKVGGERKTIQLVDVKKIGDTYTFGFEKLERWIKMCQRCGFTHFEMSHLFTQWGAKAAPKIMVEENGELHQEFGWDTPATGEAYASFLKQFLPELTACLKEWGLQEQVYFHISDEPEWEQKEAYGAARDLVKPYIEGFQMLDALSHYNFYETGLLEQPVCAIDHLTPFLEKRPEKLWTYYCCGQKRAVPNRFMAQHSGKNRILGVILYLYRLDGFLQWGYNFYNSQYSLYNINPYMDTDAGCGFQSGDAFLVYPGKGEQPEESIRIMVLEEAFSDLRFLYGAEEKLGREKVEEIIRQTAGMDITMNKYPYDPEFFLKLRENILTSCQPE